MKGISFEGLSLRKGYRTPEEIKGISLKAIEKRVQVDISKISDEDLFFLKKVFGFKEKVNEKI